MKVFLIMLLAAVIFHLQSADIPLILKNESGYHGSRSVNAGVPFPKGMLKDTSRLGLFDGANQLPVQIAVTNRWPQDGSIRWIMCDFRAPLTGSAEQTFTLKTDVPAKPSKGLAVTESPDRFVINTGTATFTVNRRNFDFLSMVNKTGLTGAGPYLVDAAGTLFTTAGGSPDSVIMESVGPERAVIRAEGWFYGPDDQKFCRYNLRTHYTAGSSELLVYYTIIITEPTARAKFRDIGFRIPGNFRDGKFGGHDGNAVGRYLLQYEYDKFLVSPSDQPAEWRPRGDGSAAPGWASAGNTTLYVEAFRENFPNELEVSKDALTYHLWPAHGVAMPERKVTDANRQYLWYCHEGKILDFQAPEPYYRVGNSYEARYFREAEFENCLGVAKTAVLRIGFDLPENNLKAWEKPPVLMASPQWMCDSGVFGLIHPYDPERFPELEKTIADTIAKEHKLQAATGPGDFGKWNYGDAHTLWNNKTGRWDDFYRCWKGYHHASGSVPWLYYIRSGNPYYFNWAVAVSRHLMDIDICNWSTEESEKPQPEKYQWTRKIKGGLNDYKGLSHWHAGTRIHDYNAQTEFALNYYFLTGDSRGMDMARMWGDAAIKNFQRPLSGREGAGTVASLVDLYLATGHKPYLELAEKFITKLYASQSLPGHELTLIGHSTSYIPAKGLPIPLGAFHDNWQNYAPWLQKYYLMTGDREAARRLVAWGDAFLAGYGDTAVALRLNAELNILSHAWRISGDEKYLRRLRWIIDNFVYQQPHSSFNSPVYFMMEQSPTAMAALSEYNRPLIPEAPEKGLNPAPYHGPQHPKYGDYEFLLKSDGTPFTFSAGYGANKPDTKPVELTLFAPDGTKVWEQKDDTSGLYRTSKVSVDPAVKGVYRFTATNLRYCRPETNLPLVSKLGMMRTGFGGTRIFFRVPENGELTIRLDGSKGMEEFTSLQLLNPAGKLSGELRYAPAADGKTKELKVPVTPGLWSLRGYFGMVEPSFLLDGHPIAPKVSFNAEGYFD